MSAVARMPVQATPYTRARIDARRRFLDTLPPYYLDIAVGILEKLYELEEDIERFGKPADLAVTVGNLEDENERLQGELATLEAKVEELEEKLEAATKAVLKPSTKPPTKAKRKR